jgi:hypothetical protein
MKPTKLLTAALIGGSLLAAAPAFADPGYRHDGRFGDRIYERHDRRMEYRERHRPRYIVERRVVERRVVVRRPVVVYREPARVYYAPRPAPVYYAPRPAPVYYGYAAPAGAGTVAGAFAGAVIGSQLGHGPDRVAGMAFGSVLGAVIGSQLDAGRY